ncbi:MAG: hypothetical protein ACREMJ_00255, partial [Gemmatimonadales bacterium]
MRLLRRHPLAVALALLVVLGWVFAIPPVVDAVTNAAPADAELVLPLGYVVIAPLANLLDALTFLSVPRAQWALGVWALGLAALGA